MGACEEGHKEVVSILLAAGADIAMLDEVSMQYFRCKECLVIFLFYFAQ